MPLFLASQHRINYVNITMTFLVMFLYAHYTVCRPVARGGGWGGVVRPLPVAHPKDFVPPFSNFVPPFSNFVPPFSNFVPPFSNFVPPFSNFVPPFSNFVPPFSNFVPPLEYVDDVTRAMSKGGVLVNVQEWGRFSNWWRHADNVQGGVRLVFHTSKFRPPPPTWLAGYPKLPSLTFPTAVW